MNFVLKFVHKIHEKFFHKFACEFAHELMHEFMCKYCIFNPGEKSRQHGNSSTHYGRERSTKNHQPVSEGISWEARIISSHTAVQKIARKLSFQVTKNDMMVAEQVWT